MQAVIEARAYISRKRPIPQNLMLILHDRCLDIIAKAPRDEFLKFMKCITRNNELCTFDEFYNNCNNNKIKFTPGDFKSRIVTCYITYLPPADVSRFIKIIARDTQTRGPHLSRRANDYIDSVRSLHLLERENAPPDVINKLLRYVWDDPVDSFDLHYVDQFIRDIIKKDIDERLMFVYWSVPDVSKIINRAEKYVAVTVAFEYLIHAKNAEIPIAIQTLRELVK